MTLLNIYGYECQNTTFYDNIYFFVYSYIRLVVRCHKRLSKKEVVMQLDNLDLGQFGAPGFTLNTRLDLSGHRSGLVDPHLNVDLEGPSGIMRQDTFRDLTNNQLPGFNGMQNGL